MITIAVPVAVLVLFCGYPIDYQVTAVIAVKASDYIEQGGLSRTGRSEYGHELTVTEIQ